MMGKAGLIDCRVGEDRIEGSDMGWERSKVGNIRGEKGWKVDRC